MSANPLKRAIMRACTDTAYRSRLLADPRSALTDEGIDVPADVEVRVHESTEDKLIVVLPTPDATELGQATRPLPNGPVADVPEGMTLTWQASTLTARGRLDRDTAPALRRELERAFADVELELSGVTLISSAGIGALVAGRQHLNRQNCTLRLRMVPEIICNVLEMAGLAEVFDIQSLVEQAALFPKGASFLFGGVGPMTRPSTEQ